VVLSAALLRQLQTLAAGSDRLEVLVAGLQALGDQVAAAVPSWSSVSISLRPRGALGARTDFAIINTGQDGVAARASLAVALTGGSGQDELVLRAQEAGAFVLLADDLAHDLGHGPEVVTVTLDRHLGPPLDAAALDTAATDRSNVEQAVGALLDQGLLPRTARAELARRSEKSHVSLAAAARVLLASLQPPSTKP
jgi:hypothetical protein